MRILLYVIFMIYIIERRLIKYIFPSRLFWWKFRIWISFFSLPFQCCCLVFPKCYVTLHYNRTKVCLPLTSHLYHDIRWMAARIV